ncbi:MAG: enoyl-CoA hydratase/isomerase family protein [Terriglobales bacterium]
MSAADTSRRYRTLMTTTQPPLARVILSHPPLNILDFEMMDELGAFLDEAEARADISAIIFAGSDRAFSAGVDVKIHTPDKIAQMLEKFHGVIRRLATTKKVTIAAVRGFCLGGGAELAAICDMVYTTDSATWGFPEISLAAFPPVAAVILPAIVGQKRAAELVLTGRQITGEDAMRMGLANEAVAEDELADLIEETAERIGKLSPSALAVCKKAFYAWDAIHFDKGLARAEQIYQNELMKLEDAKEGIAAFMEKRTPVWKGK